MLCFDKLTGEHNNKKELGKFLVLLKYVFNQFNVNFSKRILAYENNYPSKPVVMPT